MKNHELLDLIGEVNEEYVRAADGYAKRRRPVLRIGLIAACLGALLLGTAFAAKVVTGYSISDFLYDITLPDTHGNTLTFSGYIHQIDTFVPLGSLSDEVRAMDRDGNIAEYFPTCHDAEAFVGMEFLASNPVLEGDLCRRISGWGGSYRNTCMLGVYRRTDDEEIAVINLESTYRLLNESHTGYVPFTVSTYMYTEQAAEGTMDWAGGHTENGTLTVHSIYPEDAAFTREDYTTANGLDTVIIGVDAEWDPKKGMPVFPYVYEARFLWNNTTYLVRVGEPVEDKLPCENPEDYNSYALETLKTVLDGFR